MSLEALSGKSVAGKTQAETNLQVRLERCASASEEETRSCAAHTRNQPQLMIHCPCR